MPKQTVIIISGKAGMGKSHYAEAIKKHLHSKGMYAERQSFAAALKNPLNPACFDMFKCRSQDLDAKSKELFRPVLQAYGQVGRAINKNYWVDKIDDKIEESPNYITQIIDDCRFENEFYAFDRFNTIKIRINKTSANKNVNQDESETGLDHLPDSAFDILITKENSEKEICEKIENLVDWKGE